MFRTLVSRVKQVIATGVQALRKHFSAWTKPSTSSVAVGTLRDGPNQAKLSPGACDTKSRTYLLRLEEPGCNPVFCHRCPTRPCGRSNLTVRSAWNNVASRTRVVINP